MRVIAERCKNCIWWLAVLLIACQGMHKTVTPEDWIFLRQGGPHTGIWESKTVLLEYQYHYLTDEFKLSVQVKAKTKVRYDVIRVYALFVDAEGRVLERKEVAVYRLDNTYKMPPKTTNISFNAYTYRRPVIYMPPNQSR